MSVRAVAPWHGMSRPTRSVNLGVGMAVTMSILIGHVELHECASDWAMALNCVQ